MDPPAQSGGTLSPLSLSSAFCTTSNPKSNSCDITHRSVLDSQPNLSALLTEYKLSVSVRPTLTHSHILSICALMPKDLTDLRAVKGFGVVGRQLHGRKILSIMKLYRRQYSSWLVTQNELLRVTHTSSTICSQSSNDNKLVYFEPNTIIEWFRPSIDNPLFLKDTYNAKIKDIKNNFSWTISKKDAFESSRTSRRINFESVDVSRKFNDDDSKKFLSPLISALSFKSR